MPDAFFQSDRKRKRSKPGRAGPSTRTKSARRPEAKERDEELESDAEGEGANVDLDDMDFRAGRGADQHSDGELIDENETAAEKRVRMAKGYLAKVRKEVAGEFCHAISRGRAEQADREDDQDYDAAEIDRELIASRLQHDVVGLPFQCKLM